jgi:ACS family tartrate transporter-like MFS transporter
MSSPGAPASPLDPIATAALHKVTLRLIPLIALGYGIAYMDRINISYAALQMNRDLHFSNTVYGFGAGLFFLSYAACEIPSNLMLYRFGARRWLSRIMITWGLIAMGMIFVRTPMQFYAARFLLGMAEAGFFPGAIFYLTQWYPPHMRARAITRFYVAFPISTIVMGGLAGALMSLQGRVGLAGWQWLFLVEALPAIVLGAAFLFVLPDGPADASWLTQPERDAILSGVSTGSTGVPGADPHSIAPAFRDPRIWLIGAVYICVMTASYGYSFSAPAIVQRITGFSTTNVGFVLAFIGILGAASMVLSGIHSDSTGNHASHVIPYSLLMVVGYLGCGLSNSPFIALPALVFIFCGFNATQGPLWAIPATFLSGRSAAAGIAAINMIGIVGGFIGPYWMGFARDLTGDYQRGLLTLALPMLIASAIMVHLRRLERRAQCAPAANAVASIP